jgi:putative addiction module component (TIGR02574 family)
MADPARVLEEALELQPADRARLAHAIIASLDEADPDAEALWAEEIRRRVDEIEAGTAELEDWEAVRERLRAAARP